MISGENLSKDERLFVVDRIQSVGWNCACAKLFADRVRRKSVHVHLHVRAHLLVRQKLTGNDLHRGGIANTVRITFILL